MKNRHAIAISLLFLMITNSISGRASFGGGDSSPLRILRPVKGDTSAYNEGRLFLLSMAKSSGSRLTVSSQWRLDGVFDLATEESRNNFAKDFFKVVPPRTTIERVAFQFVLFQGYSPAETLAFSYPESVTIRGLWQDPKFVQVAKEAQTTSASELHLSIRGWKDSTYEAVYDDPADDQRTLFKTHIVLLPGTNNLFFSPGGARGQAVSFSTKLGFESKTITDRSDRFHNSALEEGCATCHDGLPSADKGLTMKADCNVCHKAITMGTFLHAPAEMKECGSCHSWSSKEKAVVVESGVPNTCYTCHDGKKEQVENSPNPHPVASECLTCHSQHGSEQRHLLKDNVYALCTSCHDHEAENHPVGRHPLRYKIVKKTGQPISCVACHNPHGSPNPHLLTVAGGPMEVCTQCH